MAAAAGFLSTVICLWAAVPGPPGLTWDGGWFQAAPVRRDTPPCDVIDPVNDVVFHLFKGSDAENFTLLVPGDEQLLRESGFDPRLPTALYIHGFLDGLEAEEVSVVKQAYAQRGDHNFIAVGWQRLAAGPWYLSAVANVPPVGRYVAQLLDFLEERAGPLARLHIVGHSLGAHVAGVAASNTSLARVYRVTALDPALTLIGSRPPESRLDISDAPFIDVIHTDGGNFGLETPVGHVDFYPNGGRAPQPGCKFNEIPFNFNLLNRVFCSHRRSYWLYAASVVNQTAFLAESCSSWRRYQEGECSRSSQQLPMGLGVPLSARGSYFLKVPAVPPY